MNYEVVFDVADAGYRYWWGPAVGLAFVIIGMCRLIYVYKNLGNPVLEPVLSKRGFVLPSFFTVFALAWTVLALVITLGDYLSLKEALDSASVEIIEGKISHFTPADDSDHVPESFFVNGQRFEYSWARVTAGFNQTKPHAGPVREGLWVRIAHVNGEIARLEIARPDNQ
jgi:hypothetical protein